MAGTYPDVPAPRMAYDRDGTVSVFVHDAGGIEVFSAAQIAASNDETTGVSGAFPINGYNNKSGYFAWIFPELRDLKGYWFHWRADNTPTTGNAETSTNTTNGQDGTWTSRGAWTRQTSSSIPLMRTNITVVNWTGIKAVRFRFADTRGNSARSEGIHFFGEPSATTNTQLRVWDPTLDQPLGGAALDWGDIAISSTADRTFRIKNTSATESANNITLTIDTPTPATPSQGDWHALSISGGAFQSPLNIGGLGPGAISSVVTVRRTTPSNAAPGLWWTRILAEAATWS